MSASNPRPDSGSCPVRPVTGARRAIPRRIHGLRAARRGGAGAETDRSGRISVNPDLSVPGHPEVFVIGDLAGRDGLPGVAENAMQGGLHVAACIRRDLGTGGRKDFRYRDLGSVAYISRGQAVLQAGPVKLAGVIGWLGWGFIHIAFLTGVRNRFSTVGT